jgi:Cdc6-like AAA superfamily ATPase
LNNNNIAETAQESSMLMTETDENEIEPTDEDNAAFEAALRGKDDPLPEIKLSGVRASIGGKPVSGVEMPDLNDAANLFDGDLSVFGGTGSTDTATIKKIINTIQVRKPQRQEFVQVNADPAYQLPKAYLLPLQKAIGVTNYLVLPQFKHLVGRFVYPVTILTVVSRTAGLFLWCPRISEGEELSPWAESALEAADAAKEGKWVRIIANNSAQQYDVEEALGEIPSPEWPDMPFSKLLRKAFGKRTITKADHPAILQLQGIK